MEIKRIRWFFPLLLVGYVGLSYVESYLMKVAASAGVALPGWIKLTVGEFTILLITLIYLAIVRINPLKLASYKLLNIVDVILVVFIGICAIPVTLLLNYISMLFAKNYLTSSMSILYDYPFVIQLLIIAVLPAIVEEFIFRGVIFGTYRKINVLWAVIVTGAVFGAFHLNLNQFMYAVFMGVVFAIMVEITGSMWASMIMHFVINSYSVSMLQLRNLLAKMPEYAEQMNTDATTEMTTSMLLICIALMAVMTAIFGTLAVIFMNILAERHGKKLKNIFKKKEVVVNSENVVTTEEAEASKLNLVHELIPTAASAAAALVFMILLEIMA